MGNRQRSGSTVYLRANVVRRYEGQIDVQMSHAQQHLVAHVETLNSATLSDNNWIAD